MKTVQAISNAFSGRNIILEEIGENENWTETDELVVTRQAPPLLL